MKQKFNQYLETVLRNMCSMVGANFDKINFKKEGWFRDFSWDEKKESQFKKWLIDYLSKDKDARNYLMERPTTTKRALEKVSTEFIFTYGWRYPDDTKNEKKQKKATKKGSKK